MHHYQDYYWKEGTPQGIHRIDPENNLEEINYKIVIDPYRKWISIEECLGLRFSKVVYDSMLFDFRHLKPIHQNAWQKLTLEESDKKITSLIRNQDDRSILIEEYVFEQGRCRSCDVRSIHGIPISSQRIHYKELGDKENGVYLFDSTSRPVMYKQYACDPVSGDFTDLLKEEWNMEMIS